MKVVKLLRANELRNLSVKDLKQKLYDTKKDLFNLRFQLATGQLDNHNMIKSVKKDIARINTVITEKERV